MFVVELKEDQITAALDAVAAALTDMTPVMQEIGEYLVKSTKDRFPTGKAPDGTAWAPKSLTTLLAAGARKSNRFDPRPLFGPTGALSSQILYQAGSDSVEVGSNLIYAAAMQFGAKKGAFGNTSRGSPIPWGDIPARPFLGISDIDESMLLEILADYLTEAATQPA